MRLYVVRHGEAGPYSDDPKVERDRPLTGVGRRDVEAQAEKLGKLDEVPKVIIASPFARTRETANIIGKVLKVQVGTDEQLQPHLPVDHFLLRLARNGARRLMIVGHVDNLVPGLAMLGEKQDVDKFEKGEVRRLKMDRMDGDWRELWRLLPGDDEPVEGEG